MIISRVILKNWRNFTHVDVPLGDRVFIVGANASGKSNFLDVFRFLRDIAQNGLQKAIEIRGGLSKIRCLAARTNPEIFIEVHFSDSLNNPPTWKYKLGIKQRKGGLNEPYVSIEEVWNKERKFLKKRPEKSDKNDFLLTTYTHLEQPTTNIEFRVIYSFFDSILYSHLIPQLVRHPEDFIPSSHSFEDPYGRQFLDHLAHTKKYIKESRLKKIEKILQKAVPQLKNFSHTKDESEGGIYHLEAIYEHWRAKGARQREDQLSDGTLRLIGFLWALMESYSILLLEEPELSLHRGIVRKIPSLIYQITKNKRQKSQVFISTHSYDLLSDLGIGGEEVLMLIPIKEGTSIKVASEVFDVKLLLDNGLNVGEVVLPRTEPDNIEQLELDLLYE